MKPNLRLLAFVLAYLGGVALSATVPSPELVEARKIWDGAPHNAFTDLARWRDAWWCVFREADGHVGGDGKIRVLASRDGTSWESAALVAEEGIDLRDPKICATPDGRLMLTLGGSVYRGGKTLLGRQPRVAFSNDGRTWTAPQRVLNEGDWLWRVTWHAGTAYGVSYRTSAPEGTPADTGEWSLTLYRSADGLKWEAVAPLSVPGRPNETTLRCLPGGEMLAVVRREADDKQGWLGRASPPYQEWKWKPIGRGIGGPNFLALTDGCLLVAGRDYRQAPEGPKTAVGWLDDEGWQPALTLPSGGDTSYPGMVEYDGQIWISYYASHEGKSAIYLSKVRVPANNAVVASSPDFDRNIRPILKEFCLTCHSTEKQKGDLDLEVFTSLAEVRRHPKVWQSVSEQLVNKEMPPKKKPQPSREIRDRLENWVHSTLDDIARERSGDPGPVVLRRLSNAEYTYTIRDLTGVESLDPAREFPIDGAAGEGFMNTGQALVMSPSLVTKYLDAGKTIASHAVLLPDGIRFSPSTSQRDWTEEKLAAIRSFYAQFSVNGGGSAVDLQGIRFETKDGGVLPLEKYLAATIAERDALRAGSKTIAALAKERGLNAKYLGTLWTVLTDVKPSLVLDEVRAKWRAAKPGDAAAIAATITQWQKALWRFTTVGHIGKRDGPKAWQVPVVPLAAKQDFKLKLPAPKDGGEITLYLVASDAGDGNESDFAVWENPRLVAPGRPDLRLRDVRAAVDALTTQRERIFSTTAKCLVAAAEAGATPDIPALAQKHGVEPAVLGAWLEYLGIGGTARIDSFITGKAESGQGYNFIKGWTGADALSVVANSSDQHVRIPGNMKPHSVAVHPSPKLRVCVGWRSPVAEAMRIEGVVQHAHPECGNGVTWSLELRRGGARQRLANGVAQGGGEVKVGPVENIAVRAGDLVSLAIGPRDGNHSCDLTLVDFTISGGGKSWNVAKEISPEILAGNPHVDALGNSGVWNFYSEPENGDAVSVIPAGSLLAKWQSAPSEEKAKLAEELQRLLLNRAAGLAKDVPDAVLYRQLTSVSGPLVRSSVSGSIPDTAGGTPNQPAANVSANTAASFGVDPAMFGKHPDGSAVDAGNLCVRAPSVIEVKLPADLVEGCEFVTTGFLHRETGAEGSVQMQLLTAKPASAATLAPGIAKEQGGKSTWSDGERPTVSDSPIVVNDGSTARRRIEAAFDEFRQIFPAALCYTKIVPVDEVVTLTLYYREDDQLRRLMLDDAQAAALDQLWAELHHVSQDAFKLVDAFEQLWQFATQDADPSAFEPLREPIKKRAAEFRATLTSAEPRHIDAVLEFADRAYRRPLTDVEKGELRGLYQRLREQELPHDDAIRLTLARVLVAPAFLYRAEKPGPGVAPNPVNDWELANRLSYFLWSSAPDAELRKVADTGKLREPATLSTQTRRMLAGAPVRRLAIEFACQWLHIRDFDNLDEKSERHFPTFGPLRSAMYEESIRFFTDLFQRDGSVLDILDADYTVLNEALAKHYGIPGVTGDEWRRVDGIKQFARGGILAQATTLAKQSGASRTSPILRGNWVAEALLGDKLPRPPKDVPRLPEDEAAETLTVRQLTEKHSTDPLCSGCHIRIDPFGFALESFDAIGRHRERDLGDRPIDTRVKLMNDIEFEGLAGLRNYLLTERRDAFLRQFCRKLLGYALGRAVQLSDEPLLADLQSNLKAHDYRIGSAIEMIVRSRQFQDIRGAEMTYED